MFRSLLLGRVNLVRLLQHQHDPNSGYIVQFQPDFGQQQHTNISTSTLLSLTSSTDNSNCSGNRFIASYSSNHNNSLSELLLFSSSKKFYKHKNNTQTTIIYTPPSTSDSYIEEVMTVKENYSNNSNNKNTNSISSSSSSSSSSSTISVQHQQCGSHSMGGQRYKYVNNKYKNNELFYKYEDITNDYNSRYQNNHGKQNRSDKENVSSFLDSFESLSVKLLEVGITGTAVAVGIDVRSRINEWTPSPYENGINRKACGTVRNGNELCPEHNHYHFHNGTHSHDYFVESNIDASSTLSSTTTTSTSSSLYPSNDKYETKTVTIVPFCATCIECKNILGRLFVPYFLRYIPDIPIFSNISSSISTNYLPRLNVFDQKNEKVQSLPCSGVTQNAKINVKNEYDEYHNNNNQNNNNIINNNNNNIILNNDDAIKTVATSAANATFAAAADKAQISVIRSRKKSLFFTDEQYNRIQQKIESGDIRKPKPFGHALASKQKSQDCVPNINVDDEEHNISALLNKYATEYTNRLINIIAMDLMQSQHPDEAMKCWLNCEDSAKAFFNMGVAFESGKHALNARPELNKAHDCYAMAASMGHREALYNLSLFYLYGKGNCKVNLDDGISLLEAAARKGLLAAQTFVAEIHRRQMLEEVRAKLQRKISTVQNSEIRKTRPRIYQRSTASMIGSRPRKAVVTKESITSGGTLKRVNSAPNLIGQVDSKIVRRK